MNCTKDRVFELDASVSLTVEAADEQDAITKAMVLLNGLEEVDFCEVSSCDESE